MTKGKDTREWLLWLLFTPVVIWFALLAAPCRGGSILDVFDKLTVALQAPWQITWVENSAQTIGLFLILYGGGVAVYYSTKPKLREGEEHGSAKWGSPRQLNSQIAQKDSFPLTKHVRLGMDTHKHRRNLNILVLGGSGAGKTRSMALPNIMQANCSYVITDPKGEICQAVGGLLRDEG